MSEQVLYRKYRPKSFSEIAGQEHIMRVLQNALKLGRIAHAYLFAGPRGTGKTTIARLLAKSVNCPEGKPDEPCNKCEICMEFSSGHALDLVEIDAASSRGIDEIRELREAVRLMPARAKYKVYIIDEVHMLTKEAFNALLKTLEEPPAHAIFILATTELEKVPETIISRCQTFEFKKLSVPVIIKRLEGIVSAEHIKADAEALRLVALFADGGLRDAESMLGQVLASSDKITLEDVRMILGAPDSEAVEGLVAALLKKDTSRALELIDQTIDQGTDPQFFAKLLVRLTRHLYLFKLNPRHIELAGSELSPEEVSFIKAHQEASPEELQKLLKILIDAYWNSFRTVFPQLPLELAVAECLKA
ncbi:MAG: DNA polymerase III, subunit gamma and tau [Candidatus Ryanbacteria bacterium RIFCSPHIGHO2_01_FULL_48_27]|uniref:DNA polymerase III subunit gamma/tau n=1 Tax=Candidatus Ryanbacteria bacterium RIFCSPHIGHO2_01_FULL_48_27 TaxID=1802115 RepID=A0A1G2G740_9BACT|nr:MAG: DNA polymerase III, subunit gamma and tau [Candidatus Ryanbacteria bacterium RIFCSPHIGHO2_01_FULL_48_27]